jgi:hypothetical protein
MNRHLQRYNKIISYYKGMIVEGYVEKHHIVPKCHGGTNELSNLVALPPKAHFICHYLLHKAYPTDSSLAHAFSMMCVNNPHQNRRSSGILYEKARMARSNALKGKPRSEEVKAKLRKPKSNTTNYFGNTNGKGLRGYKHKPRSQQHKDRLQKSMIPYYECRKRETEQKSTYYRNLFVQSSMSRKEFADHHKISYPTMKKYLKGL